MIFQGTPLCSVVIQSSENDRKENESRKPVKPSYVVLFDSVSYRNNPVFLFETSNLFFKKLTFTQQTVRLNVFFGGGTLLFYSNGKRKPSDNSSMSIEHRVDSDGAPWTKVEKRILALSHLGSRRGSWKQKGTTVTGPPAGASSARPSERVSCRSGWRHIRLKCSNVTSDEMQSRSSW